MKYKYSIFILFILLSSSFSVKAITKHKSFSKSFPVTENTEVQINNKYGNIQIINWDKDEVKIEVKITVSGAKEAKVDKTIVYINIDFTASQFYVIASTAFKNEKNKFWSEVADLTNSILKGGNNTEINYTVFMPDNIPLKINNKFGNVYLTDRKSKSEIKLSNGDVKANYFSAYLDLQLSYGNATIKSLNQAKIKSTFGEFNINQAQDLEINSKSSTYHCDELNNLKLDSKRDKLYLGTVNSINGKASLSHVKIDQLNSDLLLNTNFGDLILKQVSNGFNVINIQSSNTDIFSAFHQNASFKLDLIYTKKTNISFPTSYTIQNEASVGNDDEVHLRALAGSKSNIESSVKISQKSGSINLIQK